MAKSILWDKTLKNISLFHKGESIEFPITEIDDLLEYILKLQKENADLKATKNHLIKSLDSAQCQLLTHALKDLDRVSEPLKRFEAYA